MPAGVDRSKYDVWFKKLGRKDARTMLEHLLKVGYATRHQLSLIAGVSPKSTYYVASSVLMRASLAKKEKDGLRLHPLE